MDIVTIVTRDMHGRRNTHVLLWDEVCTYVDDGNIDDDVDEILLVTVNNMCIYSGLSDDCITTDDLTGFFG